MGRNKKKNIPDSALHINYNPIRKYKVGGWHHGIVDVLGQKPIFAFDFISLEKGDFCFNSIRMDIKSYARIFSALKSISDKSYRELKDNRFYHFHEVDFAEVKIKKSAFIKCINSGNNGNLDLPTLYQFKAFEEARVFGFFCNNVFYPVFFDRNHQAYKRK